MTRKVALLFAAVLPLFASVAAASPVAAASLVAARVVSAVEAGDTPTIADERPKRARREEPVRLYALVAVERAGKRRWFSDAPRVRLGGRALTVEPLSALPELTLRWYRVEPELANLSNTSSGSFRFEPISYRLTAIEGSAGRGALVADVRPTLTPDHGDGVGTMRFAVHAALGSVEVASPGPEARRGRGSGGLLDDVHRVSVRRDDTFLGYLTELYGQPYIWASAGATSATHQSERLEGSDCADFVVYAARRMGLGVEYTWSGGLPAVTRLLARGELGADGVYRDARGEPLPFPEPGDLILFPRHVGALAADRGVPGVLDEQDLLMHTLFDSPKEQPLADSGYANTTVELRRWKAAPARRRR
ncbi:MAG: hypothetical protein R3B48_07395 [Kofleriaceae bacterium]